MSAGSKLTGKHEAAIAALLTEKTHALAAERAGISEATLQRWLRLPAFQSEYRRARVAILNGVKVRLLQTATAAVDTLSELLKSGDAHVRCRAALGVLEQVSRGSLATDEPPQVIDFYAADGVTTKPYDPESLAI